MQDGFTYADPGDFDVQDERDVRAPLRDGVDVPARLAAHPLCNGDVGMYGCSHISRVQLAAATQAPPALKCMLPFGVAIATFHHYANRNTGDRTTKEKRVATNTIFHNHRDPSRLDLPVLPKAE